MPVGLPQVSFAPQQCRVFASQIAEAVSDFLVYIDLPSSSLYWTCLKTTYKDVVVATTSVGNLGFLTLKPFVLILWLLLQYLWVAIQFLAKHLFAHAYASTKKGLQQLKFASGEIWKWQLQRSPAEIAIEVGCILFLVGCIVLRRYIQQRKYVQRVTSWYRRKKRVIKESWRRGVRRIAETSLFLAMLMPHAVFLGCVAATKLLMPRVLTYLAMDTYLIALLSFVYPMIWTIGLLQYYRNNGEKNAATTAGSAQETNGEQHKTPRPRRRRRSFFPRTTPSKSIQKWLRAATTPIRRTKQEDEYNVHEDAMYWQEYWFIYAFLQALCRLIGLMPIVGRMYSYTKYAMLSSLLRQLQLVFFLWLFCVPLVTPELTKETKPLPFLYRRSIPIVAAIYSAVSMAIPQDFWTSVCQKATSFLDLVVMIKLISQETKEWLVHVLEESRPLLPPAITLFMPGFLTEYGIVYVKTLVPCAKSSQESTFENLQEVTSWLEYWVLHGLLACLLNWWAPLLWWIPFSSHVTFLLWCNLQIPKTTRKCYNILEEELQAFGLLEKGDKNLRLEETVTASMFRTLTSSLPSAASVEGANTNNNNDETQGSLTSAAGAVDVANVNNNNDQAQEEQAQGETKQGQDLDGDVVVNDETKDAKSTPDDALVSESSWSSDDNVRGTTSSNVTTRRRSTRQRSKATY